MDASEPRPRAGEQSTPKILSAGQERKCWDDDLNDLHAYMGVGLVDANVHQDKGRKFSIATFVDSKQT